MISHEKEMKCYDFPKYVFAGREMLLYYLPLINLQNSLYVFLESMANAVSRFQIVYAKSRQRYGPAFKAYRSTQI